MPKPTAKTGRFLARTAREAKRYHTLRKALISALICLVILSVLTYVVSALYAKYGSLTVSVDRYDQNKYNLTLSETEDFTKLNGRLNAKIAVDITNISGNDLPGDIDAINGEHNGKNYLAYTFYLKNVGENTVTYEYYDYIANVTNELDKAIRIRIYRDGEPITYARVRADGSGPEPGTKEFLTARTIAREQVQNFRPGDVTKFTVVIWIEGDDPECTDERIGGTLKNDMVISVIESEDSETAS